MVRFPEEKVRYEAVMMRYIARHTTIPIPQVYHYGTAEENSTGLGPFIIMEYVEHKENMSRALADPQRDIGDRPYLDPLIKEETLEYLYGQMANILLQLYSLDLPRIGSFIEESNAEGSSGISVNARPLVASMNEISIHTDAPEAILPAQTYSSSSEWYCALSDLNMAQLAFQHNDAVDNEYDAREKYVARQLFRNLARDGRLVSGNGSGDGKGSYKIFSEDLRPANVLIDEKLKVVAVIDWEFAYAAPAECSEDPPWWLLIEEPEEWKPGFRQWLKDYEPRLQTFLRVLKKEEQKMTDLSERMGNLTVMDGGKRKGQVPLSQKMRASWETKLWMVNYAIRKSWSFDFIWWKWLDERFFGPNEDEDYIIQLGKLSPSQKDAMDSFVARKMEERENRRIKAWRVGDVEDCLSRILV